MSSLLDALNEPAATGFPTSIGDVVGVPDIDYDPHASTPASALGVPQPPDSTASTGLAGMLGIGEQPKAHTADHAHEQELPRQASNVKALSSMFESSDAKPVAPVAVAPVAAPAAAAAPAPTPAPASAVARSAPKPSKAETATPIKDAVKPEVPEYTRGSSVASALGMPMVDDLWDDDEPFDDEIGTDEPYCGPVPIMVEMDVADRTRKAPHLGSPTDFVWVNDHLVFSSGEDGKVVLWDVNTTEQIMAWSPYGSEPVTMLYLLPTSLKDGKVLNVFTVSETSNVLKKWQVSRHKATLLQSMILSSSMGKAMLTIPAVQDSVDLKELHELDDKGPADPEDLVEVEDVRRALAEQEAALHAPPPAPEEGSEVTDEGGATEESRSVPPVEGEAHAAGEGEAAAATAGADGEETSLSAAPAEGETGMERQKSSVKELASTFEEGAKTSSLAGIVPEPVTAAKSDEDASAAPISTGAEEVSREPTVPETSSVKNLLNKWEDGGSGHVGDAPSPSAKSPAPEEPKQETEAPKSSLQALMSKFQGGGAGAAEAEKPKEQVEKRQSSVRDLLGKFSGAPAETAQEPQVERNESLVKSVASKFQEPPKAEEIKRTESSLKDRKAAFEKKADEGKPPLGPTNFPKSESLMNRFAVFEKGDENTAKPDTKQTFAKSESLAGRFAMFEGGGKPPAKPEVPKVEVPKVDAPAASDEGTPVIETVESAARFKDAFAMFGGQ